MNSYPNSVQIDDYLERLFPISRSLTGDGSRETFHILQEIIPLELTEYPSGTLVYDWTVPDEWAIRDAYIKGPDGERLVDYSECNLHVVGYSIPIKRKMTFSELTPHLHTLRGYPDAVPYRTSYYSRDWGFCVTGAQYERLESISETLEVCIDSEFNPKGSMTVGERRIPGETDEEYLVSTYCCHPSMTNDNLSGLLTAAFLARDLSSGGTPRRSWRFVFAPESIGVIAYLHHNEMAMKRIQGGLVVTTCDGPGPLGYKESYLGNHLIDRIIRLAFRDRGIEPVHYSFVPDGSDERQYSSPGFRIAVATITRDKYYEYPQYHTSLDNLDLVNGAQITESLNLYRDVVNILDQNASYRSTLPYGEPELGRRGLYPSIGGGEPTKCVR
jgi:aminopeptidase-like protein